MNNLFYNVLQVILYLEEQRCKPKSCLIVFLSNMYRNPDANAQNLSSTKQNKKRNTNVYFVSF